MDTCDKKTRQHPNADLSCDEEVSWRLRYLNVCRFGDECQTQVQGGFRDFGGFDQLKSVSHTQNSHWEAPPGGWNLHGQKWNSEEPTVRPPSPRFTRVDTAKDRPMCTAQIFLIEQDGLKKFV